MKRQGTALVAALVASLAGAAPASAWWAEGTSIRAGAFGVVELTALPGETNDVTVTRVESARLIARDFAPQGSVIIHDASAPVTPPPEGRGQGCTQIDANTLNCVGTGGIDPESGPDGVDYLRALLGDGDDKLTIATVAEGIFLLGDAGPGDDTVANDGLSSAGFTGGEGNDRITLRGPLGGYPSGEVVSGGPGDDVLDIVNAGDDRPVCDTGHDIVYADAGDVPVYEGDCEDYRVIQPVVIPPISF